MSGFFGGQSKERFIASGVVIACLIDVARLSVYARHFSRAGLIAVALGLGLV